MWLGKHIPAEAYARNNMMSIARQRISKHASLTIEVAFSSWSVQSSYKEVFGGIEEYRTEVKSRVSGRQPAGIWGWEQKNWTEPSLRIWQLQNSSKKGVRLWEEDFMCDLKLQWDCYKSVAWIRLVKTENPRACVPLNCKVCRIAIAL
jgi:hypothetical protein